MFRFPSLRSSLAALLSGTVITAAPPAAHAAVFVLDTDPFAGSAVLTMPGRQVVGGEPSISFDPASDRFEIHPSAFATYGFGPGIGFVNDVIANVPASGANVIVLRSFDNDADPATPFGAGNAATLIANRITTPGAGFFVYFNSALELPRLVFSTDLDSALADLKILARLSNFNGAAGQTALGRLSDASFAVVPEPSSALLVLAALLAACAPAACSRRRG